MDRVQRRCCWTRSGDRPDIIPGASLNVHGTRTFPFFSLRGTAFSFFLIHSDSGGATIRARRRVA